MKTPPVRLLPLAVAAGPDLMASDEVMLASAAAGQASFRCYTWATPTLSLGYFQAMAERLNAPRLAELPWVRRASGGAALVHHHELTYALALPAGPAWQPREPNWLCRLHGLITTTLLNFGVQVQSVLCGQEVKLDPVLCFRHQTPGDLLLNGHKVVGSAQRKQRGALLQHGGILLAQSPHTPNLPGIRELTGVTIAPAELAFALQQTLHHAMTWTWEPGDWTPTERAEQARLVQDKYAHPEWNEKR